MQRPPARARPRDDSDDEDELLMQRRIAQRQRVLDQILRQRERYERLIEPMRARQREWMADMIARGQANLERQMQEKNQATQDTKPPARYNDK